MRYALIIIFNIYVVDLFSFSFFTSTTTEITAKDQAKRLWNGIGSFLSSVKQKTLDIVDNIQDQITDFDDKLHQPEQKLETPSTPPPPPKEFDKKLLPILENASTYIEEPTQTEFQDYSKSFKVEDHKDDIELYTENSPNLRRIHSRLVPSAFSEQTFWCRLFFKLEMKEKAKKVSEELKIHLSAENSPIKVTKNPTLQNTEEQLTDNTNNTDKTDSNKETNTTNANTKNTNQNIKKKC